MRLRLSERVINREWARLSQKVAAGEINEDEYVRRSAILKVELETCYMLRGLGSLAALEFLAYLICLSLRLNGSEVPLIMSFMCLFCGTWQAVEGYRKIVKIKNDYLQRATVSLEKRIAEEQ